MWKLPRAAAGPAAALAAAVTACAVTVWPGTGSASAAGAAPLSGPSAPAVAAGSAHRTAAGRPAGPPTIQPGGPMIRAGRHHRPGSPGSSARHHRPAGHRKPAARPRALPGGPAVDPGGPALLIRKHPARGPVMSTNSLASLNWGGYAAFRPGTRFRFVAGTFFVPYLDCATTPNAQSAHWVGIDGLHDSTVEQAGISANCHGSTPVYSAWYELVPNGPVFPHITIRPGDSIAASVYFSRSTSRFTMRLADTTDGQHFSHTAACPAGATCDRTAAEAISEPPLGHDGYLPLANFRAVGYTNIRVTDQAGNRGGLRSRWWDTSRLTTVTPSGTVLDQPTVLRRGRSFVLYWLKER